jgi:hypothetical protein
MLHRSNYCGECGDHVWKELELGEKVWFVDLSLQVALSSVFVYMIPLINYVCKCVDDHGLKTP